MNYKIKCFMQTVFGLLPCGEELNYLAQKYITKGLPPSKALFEQIRSAAEMHHKIFKNSGKEKDAVLYELGCGWHLGMALCLSSFGYKNIIALDNVSHLRAELVNTMLTHIASSAPGTRAASLLDISAPVETIKAQLKDEHGITYLAPCDSANTGLTAGSVDCIYSHVVFEHIPPEIIPSILTECRRILKNDGVISVAIDYADHYRTFDKKITPYNFLKYDEKQWRKYNPPLHYVNRLRHPDFIRMFRQAGFEIANVNETRPGGYEEIMKTFPFAKEFSGKYTSDELSITHAEFTLYPTS